MNNNQNVQIKLEKVIGNNIQVITLFQLLIKRKHNISNVSLPTFKSHTEFVKNHPYRAWYLIKFNDLYIGAIYVMKSNCIGISLIDNYSVLPITLELILKKHKPLKEIKSVRPAHFFINVSPENRRIKYQLTKIGAIKIQSTYTLESVINS